MWNLGAASAADDRRPGRDDGHGAAAKIGSAADVEMGFQDYFVGHHHSVVVRWFCLAGVDAAGRRTRRDGHARTRPPDATVIRGLSNLIVLDSAVCVRVPWLEDVSRRCRHRSSPCR